MLLDEYMKNNDHQNFWKLSTGEMENLIDEAVERIEKLEKAGAESSQLDTIVGLPNDANELIIKKTMKVPDKEGWWLKIDSYGNTEMILVFPHQDYGLQVKYETELSDMIIDNLSDWLESLEKNEYQWAGPIPLEWD